MNSKYILLIILFLFSLLVLVYYIPLINKHNFHKKNVMSIPTLTKQKNEKIIKICSDIWLPYAGEKNTNNKGFIVELVELLYQPYGYEVEYINLPWTRCINEVRSGQLTMLAGADKKECEDFIFPQKIIDTTKPCLYVHETLAWKYIDNSSLKEIKLGYAQDYSYSEEIDFYLHHATEDKVISIKGEDPLKSLIQLVNDKKIDGFIENEPVVKNKINSMDKKPKVRAEKFFLGVKLYLAISPTIENSLELKEIFDRDIIQLKASTKYVNLLKKYGL